MFEDFKREENNGAKIKIIGVGGGGTNAVNKMVEDRIKGIEFYVANTDRQALSDSPVPNKIILGEVLTKGLGAGANPEVGSKAAQESIDQIKDVIEGTDLVFVTAGMGGGTGTGAAPVVAKVAKDSGALVVGIVTTPFSFEGKKRSHNADLGLDKFKENVDALIVISNNRLLAELGGVPLTESFVYSDAILKQAVRAITDLINEHSLINLDFADVKAVIEGAGLSLIGTGRAAGPNAAVEAAINAINNPLLESSIEGAKNAIVNVLGSPKTLTILQAQDAVQTIKEAANADIDVIFGVTINESMGDDIVVSVIATGISQEIADKYVSNNSNKSTGYDERADIEKYRSAGETVEVRLNNSDIFGSEEQKSEDVFAGLSMLEDENSNDNDVSEETSMDLEELLK